jgi:hypothetical protein
METDLGRVPERGGMRVTGESLNAAEDLLMIDVVFRRSSMSSAVDREKRRAEKTNNFLRLCASPCRIRPFT